MGISQSLRGLFTSVGGWVALVGLFYDRFPSIFQGIISSFSENELIINAPVAPGSAGGAVVNKNARRGTSRPPPPCGHLPQPHRGASRRS